MKPSTTDNQIAIKLENVSKQYVIHHEKPTLVEKFIKTKNEEFWALKDINLTIKKGERVGIIGPNGSGKTTLLKVIAGITTPTSGSIETQGNIVSLIDLEAGFHPDLTGIQNVYLNGMLLGMKKEELEDKLGAIIDFADIGQFVDAPLFTYSAGMTLRLGFSIAIHTKADILIFDEALVVGDTDFQEKIMRTIKSLRRDKTMLIASHDLGFLHSFCKRIYMLRDGEVRSDSSSVALSLLRSLPTGQIFRAYAQSNSMYPAIQKGDAVVVKKVPLITVRPGDVIAFWISGFPEIIIHRAITTMNKNGRMCYVSKGDASHRYDAWEITDRNFLGKLITVDKKAHFRTTRTRPSL
jgi:signal peptidase I